jgi:RP/EB family microtubule-associated protein
MSLRRIKARSMGRLELLQWLNEFLEDDYSKIEHLADGVAFCQIFDALYPGAVPLHKLNFSTKGEADYMKNLRLLQRILKKCDIDKEVPAEKLAKARFQVSCCST